MDAQKITVQELKSALKSDIEKLLEEVAEAINKARPGRIINDSEEPVRDASGEFRRQLYQKALDLLQNKQLQEDFSPSAERAEMQVE
jgi:hypothetical protein